MHIFNFSVMDLCIQSICTQIYTIIFANSLWYISQMRAYKINLLKNIMFTYTRTNKTFLNMFRTIIMLNIFLMYLINNFQLNHISYNYFESTLSLGLPQYNKRLHTCLWIPRPGNSLVPVVSYRKSLLN